MGGEIYLYGNSSLERSVPTVFRDQGDKLVLEEGDTFSAGIHCSAGVPGKWHSDEGMMNLCYAVQPIHKHLDRLGVELCVTSHSEGWVGSTDGIVLK